MRSLHHNKNSLTGFPYGKEGFTLIELSIVLVIIGLIVGGVLVGRTLIKAAEIRSQISQVEKYQTSVNTFRGKYGYLPGDIKDPEATRFGFTPRGTLAGQGDGNWLIEGSNNINGGNSGQYVFEGETMMFWVDLSIAQMLDGSFTTAAPTGPLADFSAAGSLDFYLPRAKMGTGYLYLWSGGWSHHDGNNYLALIGTPVWLPGGTIRAFSASSMSPAQANAIDGKMDDGFPQSGNVMAMDSNSWTTGALISAWHAAGAADPGGGPVVAGDGVATQGPGQGVTNTCYDNSNVAGATETYSVSDGDLSNCLLSFRLRI